MCFGGSSKSENQISQGQTQLFNTLQQNYQTQFSGQQALLAKLSSAFQPILAQGPNQYGFGPQEDAALRTQASEGTAADYKFARQANAENLAAVGGGNQVLPSGTSAEIMSQNATKAAADEATKQLQITTSGYDTGRSNFYNAASALTGQARIMDPLGYASAASGAGGNAFGSANEITQQNNARDQAILGAITGGVTGLLGGVGNLDSTGSSSGGEQAINFLTGL